MRHGADDVPTSRYDRYLGGMAPGSRILAFDDLPFSNIAREFVGADHGGVAACVILVDAPPGRGPSVHRHPYDEILIVQEGRGTFAIGDEEREVGPGHLIVVPAGVWHAFTNTGDATLRQIDIHLSPQFHTEWRKDVEDA
jgi:mannose-6-phosphate isomerase-like protein (cupin superfamily)